VQDARRHGVEIRTPDVNASAAGATLEPNPSNLTGGNSPPNRRAISSSEWGARGPVVRLGVGSVRGIGDDLAERIAEGRPYADAEDLARRSGATLPQLEALATAGAFGCFGLDRRAALWGAGAVAQGGADRLAGMVTGVEAPHLPGMEPREEAVADLWATGVSPEGHPTRFVRDQLDRRGVVTAVALKTMADGTRVEVGGVVTHRQRPATASGITFLNLEDETGLVNVVVSKGCWARYRRVANGVPALIVRGKLEQVEGVTNVVADKLEPLPITGAVRSRDFR
jgi:error-prone DNA polymerase